MHLKKREFHYNKKIEINLSIILGHIFLFLINNLILFTLQDFTLIHIYHIKNVNK